MNIFIKFRAMLRLHEAKRMADNAHEKDGERYYVMPTSNGQLIVMHKRDLRILKRKHYVPQNATTQHMFNECFYCTPYRNGDGALTPDGIREKERQYLSWVTAIRNIRKANRAMAKAVRKTKKG